MNEVKPIFDERYVPSSPVSDTSQVEPLSQEIMPSDAVKDVDAVVRQYGTSKPKRIITRVRKQD